MRYVNIWGWFFICLGVIAILTGYWRVGAAYIALVAIAALLNYLYARRHRKDRDAL